MAHDEFRNSKFKPLPDEAMKILLKVSAPPRLIAHLILVHDVACKLVQRIRDAFPNLDFDSDEILFGAATHDVGKAVHREELSAPGSLHELRGYQLLIEQGIGESKARFAMTHGAWRSNPHLPLEDLLVALADNCWKSKRVPELETLVAKELANESHEPEWQCFSVLDDALQDLAAEADARLAWQGSFSV
jgi:hypothetical protein